MATRGFSHTLAILQPYSKHTLSILISKLKVWLEPAINLVTCFLMPYVNCLIRLNGERCDGQATGVENGNIGCFLE